ncbi:PAB5 [Symbiodinium pilosum]|uniref:PAB5 protein n=1 Tax=Symbiodinium pilosum TaxID=2952 RepID=A0A812WI87_SYMPI|nr:PAB5 [Symbiodinium pilosum]
MSGVGLGYEILGAVKVKAHRREHALATTLLTCSRVQFIMKMMARSSLEGMSMAGTNLYVSGLPPGFNDAHLFQLFERFGRIWSSRVCPSRRTGGFGYAFVKYGEASHAAAAIKALNEYDVGGAVISVKLADNDRGPQPSDGGKGKGKLDPWNIPADMSEVLITGLRGDTDEDSIREIFKEMGRITMIKVCCEGKLDGQGYALARFRYPEEAQHAIRMTDGSIHRGVQIRTLLSSSTAAKGEVKNMLERQNVPTESLFVMGLPPGSTTDTITAFFGQFAGVAFVKVLDTNGKKGDTVALVRMNSLEEAIWCVDRLNGQETAPNLQLIIRYSDPPKGKGIAKGMDEMQAQALQPGFRRGFSDSPYGEVKDALPMAQRPVRSFTGADGMDQGQAAYGAGLGQPSPPPGGSLSALLGGGARLPPGSAAGVPAFRPPMSPPPGDSGGCQL